jgi:preprotein translocase subunit SecG
MLRTTGGMAFGRIGDGRQFGLPARPNRLAPGHFGHRNAAPDHVQTPAAAYMSGRRTENEPMLSVIIVIHLMLVIALIGVVLLQKSEGGGLVSSTSGFLTGRGTANVLTRTTAFLAAGFFVTSLLLSWVAGLERKPTSIIHTGAPAGQEAPAGTPEVPPISGGGGVLDLLKKGPPGSNPAPAPAPVPSGPQVPQSQ